MAQIGRFTATKGGYEGTIRTLTLNVEAQIAANKSKKGDDAPDYRVFDRHNTEIGAAWKAQSNGDKPMQYLRVTLDDPSFAEPIYAALFDGEDGADLVWSRRRSDR